MTQKHPRGTPTPNKNRCVPKTYHLPNVGHLHIDWSTSAIAVKVIGEDGGTKIEHCLKLSDLQLQ